VAALAGVRLPAGRGAVLSLGGLTVIDDTYNANPGSLRWALKLAHWLAERRRRPLAVVVGSMLELGPESARLHAAAAADIAAGAVVTALLLAFLCGPAIIRRLRERNVGQVIRAEGPASHHTKRGTPTMGGLIIILATVVPTLLWARLDSRYVVVAVAAMLWAG